MDDIERAQETEQMHRAYALAAARRAVLLPATGLCHHCDASVPSGAHFCDADCRTDYERQQAASKRNGARG